MAKTSPRAAPEKPVALLSFGAAVLVLVMGVAAAFARFPGGYDWTYTVISKLASPNQNPSGGPWLAGALLVAVGLLWPVTVYFRRAFAEGAARWVWVLRVALVGAALLALEGLLTLEFSRHVRKGHEALALTTFLGLYGGVLGLYVERIRRSRALLVPALLVVLPIGVVGLVQLALYLDQRDPGWVETGWREAGLPLWASFALWQWIAVALLGLGLGCLIAFGEGERRRGAAEGGSRKRGGAAQGSR